MKRLLTSLMLLAFGATLYAQSKLTLEDAIDTALKNNFDIRISRNAFQVDEANNTAGNAGMLPTVSLYGSTNLNHDNTRIVTPTSGTINSSGTSISSSAYLILDWTLYDGGEMFVTRQKLREAASMGDIRFRETVQAKMYEVITTYYDLIRLQQQLRSVHQTIRYNQERVTIAQTGFNSGAMSKSDLLQAKTDLNEVLETSISQEFAIRQAKRALNTLLARNPEVALEVGDSIPDQYQPNREDLYKKLNTNNASLLALQKQLEINKLTLKETMSNYLPTIDLSANYLLSTSNYFNSTGTDRTSLGPNIGGSINVPLYQGGESNRKKKVAELNVASSQADLERLQLEMNLALQNALNDFDNQKSLLKIEEENNLMTKEYLEISIQRLRLGETNSLEVHLAQEKFMSSSTRLINYRFNLKLAETKLRQLVAAL
jgi:outer membrane protein